MLVRLENKKAITLLFLCSLLSIRCEAGFLNWCNAAASALVRGNRLYIQTLESPPVIEPLPVTVGLQDVDIEVQIPPGPIERMGQHFDWKEHDGKVVGVDYRREEKEGHVFPVTHQLVLTEKNIPFEVKIAISRLLAQTRSVFGGHFQETGIGVVVTKKHIYISSAVSAGKAKALPYNQIPKIQAELQQAIRTREGDNAVILRASILHTHPGTGTPLNSGDQRGFDEGTVDDFFQAVGQKDTVKSLYAVPEEDAGKLVFALVK